MQPEGGECHPVRWVERSDDLAAVVAQIGRGPLALDTEADSFHHYREKVCLIQLSFGGRDVLVDPLGDVDLALLDGVLRDREVRKILHGADYDVRLLHRDCGLTVHGLFDTMVAARLVGERAFGLAALLQKHLGIRLDKRHQRADWSVRPLQPALKRYAVLDTRFLEALAGLLETRLTELGRGVWAEEESRRLEEVRWEDDRPAGASWLRVKGAHGLDRRQLAVLRELAELRERTAKQRDRPLFRVLRDELLVELARLATTGSVGELSCARGLPRAWKEGERARVLREAAERGLQLEASARPELPRPMRRARPTREAAARIRRVCHARDRIAASLDLEPAVLASRVLIEKLVAQLDAGQPLEALPELRAWQHDLLGPVIDAARERSLHDETGRSQG